jgi:PhnB protein
MASKTTKPVPEGYGTVTPSITCSDARREIEFLKKALGAEERAVMTDPETKRIVHGEVKLGTSIIMLNDPFPGGGCASKPVKELGGSAASFYLYVPDVDAAFARAKKAGASVKVEPMDMFWGDRMGVVECPEGFSWTIATHKSDPTPAEMAQGQKAFMESMMSARLEDSAR